MTRQSIEATANGQSFTVNGKIARTLSALVKAGAKGITALELSNTWALRLGHYVFVLRREHGLNIQTLREDHDGGWHGRYVLHTPVEILKA